MIALDDTLADVSWIERISLFRWALSAALIAGIVCPIAGVFLLVRRTSFQGIALPQFATAGVVFGFAILPWWIEHIGLGDLTAESALSDTHAAMNYHFAWAAVFTFVGLAALVWTGRRNLGSEIGRTAAAFAIANAATYLFGRLSPIGKGHADQLLTGEVLGVGLHEFETLAVVLGLSLLIFVWFQRDLLLVSFDRETARVLGKHVTAFEGLLNVVVGLTVSVGTMTLGPTMLFGLLVLPPLAARRFASSMTNFFLLSSGIGVLAVVLGVVISFELDFPLGPSIVAAAALALLPGAFPVRRST
ncbi:MAG: iron chelate uptake ABC transporter family permease subunit [Planctomycetota bacterium]|nr:iron chelate uptake ABC transporter family permease subunit [Planctomycetota bacterium]